MIRQKHGLEDRFMMYTLIIKILPFFNKSKLCYRVHSIYWSQWVFILHRYATMSDDSLCNELTESVDLS